MTEQKDLAAPYYASDWKRWRDPECPEYLDPTERLLDRHTKGARASATAILCDGRALDYRELLGEVCRAAHGLVAIGCTRESRILFFATDSVEYVATWLASVRSGLVPAVVSDAHKAHHLEYFLHDTAAATLYIDDEQLPKLEAIRDRLPDTLERVIVRESAETLSLPGIKAMSWQQLVADRPSTFAARARHRFDICYMFYSGGTTGTPKGITHLAHDFVLVPERHGAFWEYEPADIVYATSKKYFTHGLWPGLLIPLYWGATTCLHRAAASAEVAIATIERHRPTKFVTVPTLIKLILAEVERSGKVPDFKSLRFVVAASEKMAPELFERWHATFGVELMDSIGSSELTYEWIANRQKEFRRGSLGKPVFGVEIKLTDETGKTITTPDTPGDVWVKTPTRCLFYWRKLEQTQDTFHGPWTRTGDQLTFDRDGFFWFAGRGDDIFKVKGLWVSPIEVEALITRHPAVLEAAVIGVTTSEGLTAPRAFVVLKAASTEHDRLAAEIIDIIRREGGGYKVPDRIEFIPALPRTPLMKINRRELRDTATGN